MRTRQRHIILDLEKEFQKRTSENRMQIAIGGFSMILLIILFQKQERFAYQRIQPNFHFQIPSMLLVARDWKAALAADMELRTRGSLREGMVLISKVYLKLQLRRNFSH